MLPMSAGLPTDFECHLQCKPTAFHMIFFNVSTIEGLIVTLQAKNKSYKAEMKL